IQRDTCTPMFIVYVGNLGTSVSRGELERAISYYGPLRNVWIVKNPPGFAFVEFEDPRHAEDAVRGLDGRIQVCFTTKKQPKSRSPPPKRSHSPSGSLQRSASPERVKFSSSPFREKLFRLHDYKGFVMSVKPNLGRLFQSSSQNGSGL
uniref:RRM domain-containing protein n=1 Tax=Ursus maritimus TaxID=29073 RepID=A0A452VEI4_URSMA